MAAGPAAAVEMMRTLSSTSCEKTAHHRVEERRTLAAFGPVASCPVTGRHERQRRCKCKYSFVHSGDRACVRFFPIHIYVRSVAADGSPLERK